ncbi:LacI family DNA-binding transcriptional regulator [Streptomyces sp. NBC_00872]|uniref:LacI family DNA-binding transcriptional regulator n=1 Tax=Streptomyces sp. NBC_00872 TaxID=2903686 RepID=UPI00386CD76E|nr:LacI family transcriptional regulator [Streptomyces sp. NBC_00872]
MEHPHVSPQTVSNALNSPDLLAPRTLERVRRAIDELDYRPHPAARLLRSRHSRLIGLGIRSTPSGLSGPSAESFLHGLSDSAGQAGYRVLLFPAPADTANDPERYAELIRERSVDAFVLTDTYRGDRRSALLSRHGVPFVVSGRSWPSRAAGDRVDVDGARGTATAVDHLVASGHRRIAFLGWPRGAGALPAGPSVSPDRLRVGSRTSSGCPNVPGIRSIHLGPASWRPCGRRGFLVCPGPTRPGTAQYLRRSGVPRCPRPADHADAMDSRRPSHRTSRPNSRVRPGDDRPEAAITDAADRSAHMWQSPKIPHITSTPCFFRVALLTVSMVFPARRGQPAAPARRRKRHAMSP